MYFRATEKVVHLQFSKVDVLTRMEGRESVSLIFSRASKPLVFTPVCPHRSYLPVTCIRISLGTYAFPQIPKPLKTKLSAMNYFVSFIAKSFFREKKTKERQGGIKEERKKYKEEKREIAQ